MQFQDKEYYGEIWFPENIGNKEFCVLKREDNKLRLTTKLSERSKAYSADLIFGVFTGLGYVTFINNKIVNSSMGMIVSKTYSPDYCLVGGNFIENPKEFKTSKVIIVNSDLRKWIWLMLFDLHSNTNSVSYDENIKESFVINEDLIISIHTWINQKVSRTNQTLELNSKASLSYVFNEGKSIIEVIDLYHKFQKFLLFFYGSTKQFEAFTLICGKTDENFELFYKDGFHKENIYSLLNLNYQDLKENLKDLITEWFKNDDILICVDKILSNSMSSKLSFSQKFINAYIALESYLKRFSNSNGKDFKVHLEKNKELIISITGTEERNLEDYIKKIIRTRDYYVHDNIKQKLYFKGIDLLYEAIMLEYLVSILILKELKVSEDVLNKVIGRANSDYIHSKQTNLFLNRNILED